MADSHQIVVALLFTSLARDLPAQSALFRAAEETPTGDRFGGPLSVAVGDFNRDGVPDLVVGDYEDTQLVVHLGAGGGRFQPAIRTPLEAGAWQIAAADLDGDSKLDIAVACSIPI
jgi:hypothetical protein